jgi:tetraacyldisaccharide 4'-kinase
VSADSTLQRVWYERSPLPLFLLLLPLSGLFAVLSALRRLAFRRGLLRTVRVSKPVIVVGNITVGGTGKTPLTIWIVEFLQSRGLNVGVVMRGYGGTATSWPQDVTAQSPATAVGDEAVLIAARTGAIVVADADRVAAANRAIALGADVIVADDGLQHYRLQRDAEIAVVDAQRGLGNGCLLPAGPLRESAARLDRVDLVVGTVRRGSEGTHQSGQLRARHEVLEAHCIATGERRALSTFAGAQVHAVAAIGNPNAFFSMLREHGLEVNSRALRDHAAFERSHIEPPGDAPVLMTEKDAVKCRPFASERHWAVRLDVRFDEHDTQAISALLTRVAQAAPTTLSRVSR